MPSELGGVRLERHLPGLDGVRGLAILGVMLLHFVSDSTPQNLLETLVVKATGFGLLGVDLFFVLSGFLITGLLLDAKPGPGYFRNFYARRTLRIFPLYYLVLALLFFVLPLATVLPPALEVARVKQAWLWSYTANYYVAARGSWSSLGYVTHFWSLAIEEQFYLAWPLVVFLSRRETLERICGAVIVVGLGLRIALAVSGVSEISISVFTPCRVDTLCVGGLVATLVRRPAGPGPLVRRAGAAALGIAGATLVVSVWCAATKVGLPVLHQVRSSLYALFFAALTLLSLRPEGVSARLFRNGALRTLGKYSYGLYVYHGLFSYFLTEQGAEERLTAALGSHAAAMLARAVLGFGISFLVSWVSYELFERRFLALKRFFEVRPSTVALPRPVEASADPARPT